MQTAYVKDFDIEITPPIIEDAVTDPAPAALLKFKSEYEFVT